MRSYPLVWLHLLVSLILIFYLITKGSHGPIDWIGGVSKTQPNVDGLKILNPNPTRPKQKCNPTPVWFGPFDGLGQVVFKQSKNNFENIKIRKYTFEIRSIIHQNV